MATMSAFEYETFCRNDFLTFVHRAFLELNPHTPFLHNWHIDLIAAKLEACRRGEIKRLIINLPPRSLKSHLATVCSPAFLLGHQPAAQIICASYGQDLANKHSLDCRTLMSSQWYQRLFPTRLAPHKQSLQEFLTTDNGFRLATSVGGVLTGRGADFIIIDDPLKPDEALSETQRNAVNQWFDHTLCSRLNDKRTGCIIVIMQRLHEDDLVGHVLEKEPWEHLKLPAIAEEDEVFTIESSYRATTIYRQAGGSLHPEREPIETLQHLRRLLGEYNFAGQYQQQPSPAGGALVKAKWFRTYRPEQQPPKFHMVFQSWDTANKSTELSDYSVCTTWGVRGKRLFLLDVLRERLNYPSLKRAVLAMSRDYKPRNILIEDKASGTQLIQELINAGVDGVTRYEPQMEKIMRLHSVTSTIENGFVYLPKEADWLAVYVHELTTFPSSKHDDQTDSTSQALDWVKSMRHHYPMDEYLQRQALLNGWSIDPRLLSLDELETYELGRRTCLKCGNPGPARYGQRYHCNQCGNEWQTVQGLSNQTGTNRYILPSGESLLWDPQTGLWVDPVTGDTYAQSE